MQAQNGDNLKFCIYLHIVISIFGHYNNSEGKYHGSRLKPTRNPAQRFCVGEEERRSGRISAALRLMQLSEVRDKCKKPTRNPAQRFCVGEEERRSGRISAALRLMQLSEVRDDDMDRQILLSDLNSCYASIEVARRPELRGKPVAVCGSVEHRHGIILAKSEQAKKAGVKTGMARWQALQCCPDLITVPPNIDLYIQVTGKVREIYSDYSDLRDDFSIDESWIDLTGTCRQGREPAVAEEIKVRLKAETGLTASIGLSWNKIFAKLGSDIAPPDSVAEITRDNMSRTVYPLPVEHLFGVGRATKRSLNELGVMTIGELAATEPDILKRRFGKNGLVLYAFANGLDNSPVRPEGTGPPVKSIGNSTTTARDMVCDEDVRIVLMTLAESVGTRLREHGLKCFVPEFSLRTTDLHWRNHQRKLERATDITREIFDVSFALYRETRTLPLRSIGVRAAALVASDAPEQLDFFTNQTKLDAHRTIDRAVDDIRRRYGYHSIRRGLTGTDEKLGMLNAREEHINFASF